MSFEEQPPLKWSAQYVLAAGQSHRLQGDKINLPQHALEQLLSASMTTVQTSGVSSEENGYRVYNEFSTIERQQNLPNPLMFRLVNPVSGNVAYAGIREFTANDGEIELSSYLVEALGVKRDGTGFEDATTSGTTAITVHAQSLPKGTFVRFRPLEAGYNPEDWKPILEKYMRNNFTTLIMDQTLTIPSGKDQYRFVIDKVVPESPGICIIDTDLEVDIEPMDEEQARETLRRIQEKAKRAEGTSTGGVLAVEGSAQGQVATGEYVDYTIKTWDRSKAIEVVLHTEHAALVDLYVSPMGPRQRAKPRIDEHLFEDISDRPTKRVCIRPTNIELEAAETIAVSVSGYRDGESEDSSTRAFTISISNSGASLDETNDADDKVLPLNEGDVRCKNCNQWVPGGRMFLHENFCLRNNVRCPKCQQVFHKSSSDWTDHWHCDQGDAVGNSKLSQSKHNKLSHTLSTCKFCGEEALDAMATARHRITTCPDKEILCQFCHLLVPQKGAEDPEFTDPEVMLSGLTPHELADGARTTECHLCSKIVRLRDMTTHLKSHDLDRLSRPVPRLCRNVNCGRTLDGVGPRGQIKPPQTSKNDLGLCDTCFGPLYNSAYDPEHKALKRRVERRHLTQLVTGCGKSFCHNEYCKNGRFQLGIAQPGQSMTSKDALMMTRPELDRMLKLSEPLHFCTDDASQKRRILANMITAEHGEDPNCTGYSLPWSVAALEAESGDLAKARQWLGNFAPTRAEER